ncbi:MAG: isocitrate/isopropylmalate family dehydrogenase, partial [Pseudomonadota bacterium]
MRIAIVGAGIAGMGAALAMAESHEVRLFEAEPRAGGHAHTVEVAFEDGTQPVDMGFIVFNAQNYPNICALFEHLEVPSRWSDMSFGFSLKGGRHEYACDSLDKLFAQRWRALDPRHVSGLREIRRFQTTAPALLERGALDGSALGDWLAAERGLAFEVEEDLVGGCAYDAHGVPLADATMAKAQEADAVLLGAVGGPKYDAP